MIQYKKIAVTAGESKSGLRRFFSAGPAPLKSRQEIPTDPRERLALLYTVSTLDRDDGKTRTELKAYFPLNKRSFFRSAKDQAVVKSPSHDHLVVLHTSLEAVGEGHISVAMSARARIVPVHGRDIAESIDTIDKSSHIFIAGSTRPNRYWEWITFVRSILIQEIAQQVAPQRVAHIHGWYRTKCGDGGNDDMGHIIMDRLPGITIKQLLTNQNEQWRSGKDISQIVALRKKIVCEIAVALAELHRGGVVQNDLNPGNFMVDIDPDTGTLLGTKVLDFECAYLVHGPGGVDDKFDDPLRNEIFGIRNYVSADQSRKLTVKAVVDIGFKDEIQSFSKLLLEIFVGEFVSPYLISDQERKIVVSRYGQGYLELIQTLWSNPTSLTMSQIADQLQELMTPRARSASAKAPSRTVSIV